MNAFLPFPKNRVLPLHYHIITGFQFYPFPRMLELKGGKKACLALAINEHIFTLILDQEISYGDSFAKRFLVDLTVYPKYF